MTKEQAERLTAEGIYVYESLERLGNNMDLLDTITVMFTGDKSFKKLIEGVDSMDDELAYDGTHTLKSLAGNLSMHKLYELCEKQYSLYKSGKVKEAWAMTDEVSCEYERVLAVIKEVIL